MSDAGLHPVLALAQAAGLHDDLARLTVPSPNAAAKTMCIVAGMIAGADSIDDLDRLRHGAMRRLFTGIRAPSTLGTHLRAFTHGHVQQLDRAGAVMLAGLAGRVPGLIDGAGDSGIAYLDIDDTVREVHGYAKQGAAFGYTGQRGLNIQFATLATPLSSPVILRGRLRRGNTVSASGAARMTAQAITTARAAGVAGQIMVRADSGYFGHALIGSAARRPDVWFSVTARMNAKVKAAIAGIDEAAWTPIHYPHAVWDEEERRWISDAEVAEIDYVAFTSRRKTDHVPCRLVVRRVVRLGAADTSTGEDPAGAQQRLCQVYRHHAFITNSTLSTVDADITHRAHAIVEQVIAELKAGPLAHLPSGDYGANAAWVACAVIAFNLARATAVAAGLTRARLPTIRTRLINIAARIATTSRRTVLHLPRDWPWAPAWRLLHHTAHAAATGPPAAAAT